MDGERAGASAIEKGRKSRRPDKSSTEMESVIDATGRKEMVLDIDKDVPVGRRDRDPRRREGQRVHNIINNQRPR